MWQVVNSGSRLAQDLMDLDKELLETQSKPTIHFYRFQGPSLTYGLLMDPAEHLNLEVINQKQIRLGKRPTGGGALFHMWDLAFSVVIPLDYIPHVTSTLDRYLLINKLTEKALEPFLKQGYDKKFLEKTPSTHLGERFCMAKPTQYDLIVEGKKCVGAAQRATKKALLHQATISLCAPDMELLNRVLLDKQVAKSMQMQSFHLAEFPYTDKIKLEALQGEIEASLLETFNNYFDKVFHQKVPPSQL